jgi:hypothetical protein
MAIAYWWWVGVLVAWKCAIALCFAQLNSKRAANARWWFNFHN